MFKRTTISLVRQVTQRRDLHHAVTAIAPAVSADSVFSQILETRKNVPEAKSLFLTATAQYATNLVSTTEKIQSEHPDIQIVAAAVDTVGPSCSRDGLSAVWFDRKMTFKDTVSMEGHEDPGSPLSDSRGLSVGRTNWTTQTSLLSVSFGATNVVMPLANTLFTSGSQSTLFFSDRHSNDVNNGHNLAAIAVNLPFESAAELKKTDNWTPALELFDYKNETQTITQCRENLIKEINGLPASSFLQNCPTLVANPSKDTLVFATLGDDTFKVIAGGGGWGNRASMLVLDPGAKLKKGKEVKFKAVFHPSMFPLNDKPDWLNEELPMVTIQECKTSVCFQCSPIVEELVEEKPKVMENMLAYGSESGFLIDELKHEIPNELVVFS
ncbi:Hypothetical protein YALI2_F00798g [Yarrowia lipolytica]|nr:Hypothetical protein YALI2_F00798g [Yarrowia lipolytica]